MKYLSHKTKLGSPGIRLQANSTLEGSDHRNRSSDPAFHRDCSPRNISWIPELAPLKHTIFPRRTLTLVGKRADCSNH